MAAPRTTSVLVVEGDASLRASTAEVLASAGYDVRVAGDADAARAAATALPPDLALVHVGVADGWALVRALREDPLTADCPIVATGGHPIAAHAREPMLAEVEAYLSKPSDPDFLLAVIVGALGGGGVAARASRERRAVIDPDGL